MADGIDLVSEALAAVRAGDADAARRLLTDDFIWRVPGTSPIAGDTHGADEWVDKFQRLVQLGLKPEILATLEGPDHVATVQRNTADIDGHMLDVRVVNLFTIRGGKVAAMETFFDDQAALDGFWTAVLGAG